MKHTSVHAALAMFALLWSSRAPGQERPTAVPFVFAENTGQWHRATRFVAANRDMVAHFEGRAIALQLLRRDGPAKMRADVIRLEFVGTAAGATLVGGTPSSGRFHYFTGDRVEDWRSDVRSFATLRYRDIWRGVDVRVRDSAGTLEYDVILAPRADLADVVVRCVGARDLRIERDGRLALSTKGGVLRQSVPVAWTVDRTGRKTPVECAFRIIDDEHFGFEAPGIDEDESLVIDPGLEWSTFLGGANYDYLWRVVREANGDLTVAGYTASSNFPTVAGSYDVGYNGKVDAVVSRLSPDGRTLRWSTFMGGGSEDWFLGLAVGSSGAVTLTGFTKSRNFPTTAGAYQVVNKGGFGEAFVAQLDKNGSKLNYSTYLGGSDWDYGAAVEVDKSGNATVIGITKSTNFPMSSGAYDTTHNGGGDGFVARLNATGTKLLFSTFLGSSGWDPLSDLVLDDAGNVFVIADVFGVNNTSNFPTTPGAYDTTYNDKSDRSDTIVCKLSADGKRLLWSTWLGGNSWDPGYSIVLDSAGNPTICGESWSTDFPTTAKAYQKTNSGLGDAYVARLSSDGSKLLFCTLIGGRQGEDRAFEIALDPFDSIVISGWTSSSDFPTTAGAISRTYKNKADTFVARFDPDASVLYYSTLFGGTGNDHANGMALDPHGAAIIVGDTFGTDFRTTAGTVDPTYNGRGDAYVARLSVLPTGVDRYGDSAPACTTVTTMGITVQPRENTTGFAILGAGAPPRANGMLIVGIAPLPSAIPFVGARLWIDISKPHVLAPIVSNSQGRTTLPVPIGSGLRGTRIFSQFLWANTAACGGAGTLSSSQGIDLTVQ